MTVYIVEIVQRQIQLYIYKINILSTVDIVLSQN